MELKEFDIILDIKNSAKTEDFEVVQGDINSNIFNITLTEGFKEYDLTDLNVEIVFSKPDGTTVLQSISNGITVVDNKIICVLSTNSIASPGKVTAEVRVSKLDKILTSTRFYFHVRKAIINDETIISTNEFPLLNQAIDQVNALIQEVSGMDAVIGDSAYQVWLNEGNTGTVDDYLMSLIGPQGEKGEIGPMGPDGKNIEYIWSGTELGVRVAGDTTYEYVDLEGPVGPEGPKGTKGEAGTSLQILGNYNTLTELLSDYPDGSSLNGGFMVGINYYYWNPILSEWENAGPLQGPEGPKGDDGPRGIQGEVGPKGEDGKNIEYIWNGTQLGIRLEGEASYTYVNLKGEKGDKGIKGDTGNDGQQGPQGETGPPGSDASVNNTNVIDAIGYTPLNVDDTPTKTSLGLNNVDNLKQMPISGGVLENYREKLTTLSGTSTAINLSLGNVFTHTLSGNTTYSISNAVSGQAHSFTLIINMGSTVRTLTFPSSVKWHDGEIPDMTEGNKRYYLWFNSIDGGTRWDAGFGGEF